MNQHQYWGYGYGNGYIAGMLTLGFIILVTFFVGLALVMANNSGRAKIWGFLLIVIAILLSIVALLLFSATRTDLW